MEKHPILRILLFIIAPLILLLLFIGFVLSSFFSLPKTESVEVKAEKNTSVISNKRNQNATIPTGVKDQKLQTKADSFLRLFGNMPSVPVFIRDESIIKTGSETQKGVGYTVCLTDDKPTIYIKKVFYSTANEKQLDNILKHELVHAWFCRQGVQVGHDERFRKKFKEIGGFGN